MTRGERRDRMQKAKCRAARLWTRRRHRRGDEPLLCKGWDTVNGRRTYHLYTAREIATVIAQAAEVHSCWCSCWMCSHHKSVPARRERSALSWRSDAAIEAQQEAIEQERQDLAGWEDEMREIEEAFGHALHRSLLQTEYQRCRLAELESNPL